VTGAWQGPPLPPHWTAAGQLRLVGREPELRALREACTAAVGGARQVVLVGGESGAGKSRLVIEAATWCARAGAAVLVGSCVAELGSPYQPFAEPVGVLLTALADGTLGPGERDPELVDLLGLAAGRSAVRSSGGGHEYRPRLYGAVLEVLRAAAAVRPVALVLEDVHWAAPDGLQLLTYLVQHTGDLPLLLLATHRTTAPDRSPAVVRALTHLHRLPGVQRVDLTALGVEAVTDFLVAETGEAPSRVRPAARALHRHTGGNPFFLREVWRDLAAHGGLPSLDGGPLRAPESVRDTFLVRLDGLPAPTRQLLELAAVLGEEVDVDTLLALDAAAPAPAGPDAALDALDAAVDLGLVEPVEGRAGQYRFRHALARQAVLELMPPSRLTRYHALAADVLEKRPCTDRWVQRLAHHCASARALGYGERAVGYLVEAAELAARALAHDEAADLFERAASLATAPERQRDLQLRSAGSHFLAGRFPRAMELDATVFERGGPRDRLTAAIGYEIASWHLAERGHRAAEMLGAALSGIPQDPADPLYVRGLAALARALAFTGALDEAAALADRSIGYARELGDDRLLADTLQAGVFVGGSPATSSIRLSRASELMVLAERTGDLAPFRVIGYQRATIGYQRGDRRMVEEAHADMLRAARITGQRFWEYVADGFEHATWFMSGDLVAADRAAQAQRNRGRAVTVDERVEGPFGLQTFMVRREAGRLDEVRPLISGSERPQDLWAPGLLALYTDLGLTAPARRVLRWLVDEGLDRYEEADDWPATLAFLAEAAIALEDEPVAEQLRPRLAEYAGLNLAAGLLVAVFGSADRYRGALGSLLHRREAMDDLDAALEMDMRMSAPLHVAHTRATRVAHLRRVRAPARTVAAEVEEVRRIAEPLGLRRVLRGIGTAGPGRPGPDGLTSRELEILRLLAGGLSNRDIARQLVISESTAANHVRSIFQKTGAANRTQAARYATAHDLAE
jgi:DNA-binding CsgD family transcriptional regulator